MVYNQLLNLKPHKQNSQCIYLVEAKSSDGEDFVDVCCYNEDTDEIFAIDFMDWSEIIDMKIKNTIEMPEVQTLSHILWEITFWGFSQAKIQEEADRLSKSKHEPLEDFSLD